jgi:NitT/TauT family transport system substrate-binding protein
MAPTNVSLRLDWVPSWYHAPFYVALEKGYYRDAGLIITIQDGQGSNTTGQVVASGAETFGFMSLLSVPLLADKGAQLRAIGTFIQTAPEGVITLAENGINSPKDLEGKTWGYTPGSSSETLFPYFAAKTGVDESKITKVNVDPGARLPSLLSGKVQFYVSWSITQNALIQAQGRTPKSMDYADHGAVVLGHGFVATAQTLSSKPELARAFLAATAKGIEDTIKDPAAAVDALIKNRSAAAPNRSILVGQVTGLAPYLHTKASAGKPLLWTAPEDWETSLAVAKQHLGVSQGVTATQLYTNEFLPSN